MLVSQSTGQSECTNFCQFKIQSGSNQLHTHTPFFSSGRHIQVRQSNLEEHFWSKWLKQQKLYIFPLSNGTVIRQIRNSQSKNSFLVKKTLIKHEFLLHRHLIYKYSWELYLTRKINGRIRSGTVWVWFMDVAP